MRRSRNFFEHEIAQNARRPDLVTPFEDLTPRQAANGQRMIDTSLQPMRDELGRILVLGFYRGPNLNAAVDGIEDSLHLLALATDFLPADVLQDEAWEKICAGIDGLTFDHMNFYRSLEVPTFHVDHRPIESGPPRMKLYVDWERI